MSRYYAHISIVLIVSVFFTLTASIIPVSVFANSEQDLDQDGIVDEVDIDDDGDGYPDCYERDKYRKDHDNDGIKDIDDPDDDNDSIADTDEAADMQLDRDNDGKKDETENRFRKNKKDDDKDGIPNKVETKKLRKDHDNDGIKNGDDLDDDGDGVLDRYESKKNKYNLDNDRNQEKKDAYDADIDNDGIKNWLEETCSAIQDTDNDGKPNDEDTDDDNDGIEDYQDTDNNGDEVEDDTDQDNDTIPDTSDTDDNNDGYIDEGNENLAVGDDFTLTQENGRVWYGWATVQYNHTYISNNSGGGSIKTDDERVEFRLDEGPNNHWLYLTEVSGSAHPTLINIEDWTEIRTTAYDISATSNRAYEMDIYTLAHVGNIYPESGIYHVGVPLDENDIQTTYQLNGEENFVEYFSFGMGLSYVNGTDYVECTSDMYPPATCHYFIDEEGIMKGSFDYTNSENSYATDDTNWTSTWKIYPTLCDAFSSCVRPDAAKMPDEPTIE